MIVVDASLVVDLLARAGPPIDLERLGAARWYAPHVLDAEVLQGLRGLVLRAGRDARDLPPLVPEYLRLPIRRYPAAPLLDRVWALRANLTAYDACYVALAEALGAPLLTRDARLAAAPGHRARVELV